LNAWDRYSNRLGVGDRGKRNAALAREQEYLRRKLPSHLSYKEVSIDGEPANLAIINSDNLNMKTLCSMPGESFSCGSTVFWAKNYWIITTLDADNEVYTKGTMTQCNYVLRWIAKDGMVVERNCIVDDGTRYLTGESVSRNVGNGIVLGDTRIAVTLPRDEYTVQLNRDFRFLIDDYESENVLAYRITKPFKIGGVYNGQGAMSFVLSEVNLEEDDNVELHIADYYKYFPRKGGKVPDRHATDRPIDKPSGRKEWL